MCVILGDMKAYENDTVTMATFVYPRLHPAGPQASRQGVGSDDGGLQSIVKRPPPERPATTGTCRPQTFPPAPGMERSDRKLSFAAREISPARGFLPRRFRPPALTPRRGRTNRVCESCDLCLNSDAARPIIEKKRV